MIEVLSIILSNLVKAIISVGIIYIFKVVYNLNKREISKIKSSSKRQYTGDFIILATKISFATLTSYYYVRSIYSIFSIIHKIDSNIIFQVIALVLILSIMPILFIYFVILDVKKNYI